MLANCNLGAFALMYAGLWVVDLWWTRGTRELRPCREPFLGRVAVHFNLSTVPTRQGFRDGGTTRTVATDTFRSPV